MKHFRLEDMTGGWFVGEFTPTGFATEDCEVAVKTYRAGQSEAAHFHKVATELTLIISGRVRMLNKEWGEGDIIVLSPGEATSFEAITDATNVVVKVPSVPNDKYLTDAE